MMEFLDIGSGISLRLDRITALEKTDNSDGTQRIAFYTDNMKFVVSEPADIEFIEDFFLIRTFKRRT